MSSKINNLLDISFGPLLLKYLKDPDITEVMKNDDGKVFATSFTKGNFYIGDMDAEQAWSIVTLVASHINKEVTYYDPIVSAELPENGYRFEGNIPPVSATATFNIRKHSVLDLTLDNYVENEIMTKHQAQVIREAAEEHRNILVVGGTNSGKTTLCNAILNEISKYNERIIILQDTNELKCTCENRLFLRSTKYTSIKDLLTSTLRRTPKRIVVGEVRTGEVAQDLIDAWNTGHGGGLSTVHGNDEISGLNRLSNLISRVSKSSLKEDIGEAIDLVIDIQLIGIYRKVQGVIKVKGYDKKEERFIFEKIA